MKLISWNINGIRSAEDAFLGFMAEHQPDILMLQEVRAFPEQLSLFLQAIPGYEVVFHPAEKAGYSGTAVYYKSSLGLDRVGRVHAELVLDSEGRTLEAVLGNLHIVNVYTPNGTSGAERLAFKLEFYEALSAYMWSLVAAGKSVILGGDLNVAHTELDLYNPQESRNHSGFLDSERAWIDGLLSDGSAGGSLGGGGFVDTFRIFEADGGHYSWWHMRDPKRASNRGWRFDYFLVSEDLRERVKAAEILRRVFGSDHAPVGVEVKLIDI